MTLDKLKLKLVIFLLKHTVKIGRRLAFYKAKYSAGEEVGKVAQKQKFDLRKMNDRMKNVLLHDQDIIDKRRAICDDCEFKIGLNCKKCGCFIAAKTRVATVGCPIGKWDKEYEFIKGEPTNGTHIPAK